MDTSLKTVSDLIIFDNHKPQFSTELTPRERCVRGQPRQYTWHHFTSADGRFHAGLWEADPGCWRINYTENEYCQILEGLSLLRDGNGDELELHPGENLVIPAGFRGEWEVVERTKKIYVICEP